MLDTAVDEVSSGCVKLVYNVIVAAGQDVLGVVGELNGGETSILTGEILDALSGLKVPELSDAVTRC